MARVRIERGSVGASVEISGADAKHLTRVLRLSEGDSVVAFDGAGGEWHARIARVAPMRVTLTLTEERRVQTESPCRIVLGQAVGKGEKLDLVVRAATELGVATIVPVATERAIAEGGGKVDRWRRIAEEACKQCGRSVVPAVAEPEPLAAFLERTRDAGVKLVPWEGGGERMRAAVERATDRTSAALLVGPEGGLAEREVAQARAAGYTAVTLGPRILRTETAGIVAVAALQLLAGDLG